MKTEFTSSQVRVIDTLAILMPGHQVILSPSKSDVAILWPKSNTATDVYEINFDSAEKVVTNEPDKLGDLLHRVSRQVEQKTVHVSFKDYRVVDTSHINKLHSLLSGTYSQSEVTDALGDSAPIIHGLLALPSNFVLVQDFNKTVSDSTFDPELGMKYLKDKMEVEADAKLWELEGYRLYRSLMSIDGYHDAYGNKMVNTCSDIIDPAVLVANCATVWVGTLSDMVYLEIEEGRHRDVIATSEGKVGPCLVGITREYYERMLTVINTYIEFQ